MAKHVISALYEDFDDAQDALEELVNAGFAREDISLVAADDDGSYTRHFNDPNRATTTASEDVSGGEGAGFGAVVGALIGLGAMAIPGIGPVIAAGPLAAALIGAGVGAAAGAVTGGIAASLIDMGVDSESATYYEEGIRRGGTLVVVNADENFSERAVNILNNHNPIDLNTRGQEWRASGWSGYSGSTESTGTSASMTGGMSQSTSTTGSSMNQPLHTDDEVRAQVVEEDLKVGKREVDKGSVRVHTYVTEKPVEEQVTLRDEHVTVERRPVDRPASSADFNQGEKTFEISEHAEEPVVSKEARVVEEVVVRKDVDTHTETVSDTVRRQDVEVDRSGTSGSQPRMGTQSTGDATVYQTTGSTGAMTGSAAGMSQNLGAFESFDPYFREHYNNTYMGGDYDYDYYIPAYEYGYRLASDERYRDYDWSSIEASARRNWEDHNPDTWDDIKDAVHDAWMRVKNAFR